MFGLFSKKAAPGINNDTKPVQAYMQRYRELYENLRDGALAVGTQGRIVECNRQFLAMLGYPLDEVRRLTHEDITPARWHAMELALLEKHVRRRGYSDLYEKEYMRKDGSVFPVELQLYLVRDGEGKPAGYWALVRDISERRKSEDELRIFTKSVENSADAIGMSTPEGRHFYQNQAFDDLFGTAGEKPPETVYVDADIGREVFRTIMAGGQWTGEVKMYAKDRRVLTILLRAYASKDKNGRIAALVGVHTDITERTRAESRMEAALEKLRDSEQRMKAIVDGSPIPQFVIDKNHSVIHWNRALEEYSGIRAEDVLGTNRQWQAFYGKERPCMADLIVDGAIDSISQWYAGKLSHSGLLENAYAATDFFPEMKGGTWLHFTAAPIPDAAGNIIGAVETLDDITEPK